VPGCLGGIDEGSLKFQKKIHHNGLVHEINTYL